MPYTPNPTVISGGTGTGNISQYRRIFDVSKDVAFYNPNANPFYLLAQQAGKEESIDPEFRCLEAQIQPVFDDVSGAQTAGDTSIEVDHGSYFKAEDLVLNTRTKEIFKVTSVAANTLTVVRGYGSVSAQAMNDDDELRRVGNAFEEGADVDTAKTVKVDTVINYCQLAALTGNGKVRSWLFAGTSEYPTILNNISKN
jgi:hypothetical protein